MGICIIYLMSVLIAFGVFELNNNKVCFKSEFMDKQFTKAMKGIAITMVFLSHVGNANNVRLFAPLGGWGLQFF